MRKKHEKGVESIFKEWKQKKKKNKQQKKKNKTQAEVRRFLDENLPI